MFQGPGQRACLLIPRTHEMFTPWPASSWTSTGQSVSINLILLQNAARRPWPHHRHAASSQVVTGRIVSVEYCYPSPVGVRVHDRRDDTSRPRNGNLGGSSSPVLMSQRRPSRVGVSLPRWWSVSQAGPTTTGDEVQHLLGARWPAHHAAAWSARAATAADRRHHQVAASGITATCSRRASPSAGQPLHHTGGRTTAPSGPRRPRRHAGHRDRAAARERAGGLARSRAGCTDPVWAPPAVRLRAHDVGGSTTTVSGGCCAGSAGQVAAKPWCSGTAGGLGVSATTGNATPR